ncbi:guanine nucleotide-binding protein subunit alpha [Acrasis kona]|uniref:Guanine nucleotide-binding protein subunit alpha n=1 Tax=Acrasis kona TaxID=1008807 RepID=A0AAW2YKL6_9EUKA
MGNKKSLNIAQQTISRQRILLLGTGESGKSVLYRQFCLGDENCLFKNEDTRRECKYIIYSGIIKFFKTLCLAVEEANLKWELADNMNNSIFFTDLDDDICLRRNELSSIIKSTIGQNRIRSMWSDATTQTILRTKHKHAYQFGYCIFYFMSRFDVLVREDYIPSQNDILHMRCKTTGITEHSFVNQNISNSLIDVGQQRGERKKVIHCFPVQKVILCLALDCFLETCYEDNVTSRLTEQINYFEESINSRFLVNVEVVLVLTHGDLLQEYLPNITLQEIKCCGGMENFDPKEVNVKSIAEYILDLHLARVTTYPRKIGYIYNDIYSSADVVQKILDNNLYYRDVYEPEVVEWDVPYHVPAKKLLFIKVPTSLTDVFFSFD